ncbi:MAG: hypothetical protein JW891_10255 [Candidatus Lokiarchaeota archaeon]|nr:hypothetical protein [Candidatus Lokiarchaeota archaeon]
MKNAIFLPDYNMILIRYNEIWLKSSKVKMRMLNTLMKNIKNMLTHAKIPFHKYQLSKDTSRIFFFFKNQDIPKAVTVLKKVVGIYSFSPALRTSSSMKNISEKSVHVARQIINKGDNFALNIKRSGNHDYSSKDVAMEVGKDIVENFKSSGFDLRVNLSNPDKTIFVEIREDFSYVFTDVFKSDWGGLPIETSKKIAVMDVGRPGDLLAGFLLLRRGSTIFPILFDMMEEDADFYKWKTNWSVVNNFTPFSTLSLWRVKFKKALKFIKDCVAERNVCGACRMLRFATIASVLNMEEEKSLNDVRALTDGFDLNKSPPCPDQIDLLSLSLSPFFSERPIFTPNIGLDEETIKTYILKINKNMHELDYCPLKPQNQEFNPDALEEFRISSDFNSCVQELMRNVEKIFIK